jgi:hypothetical protein
MVELQNDWIRLPAVQAAVLPQIIPRAVLILSPRSLVIGTHALELMIAISHVPIAFVVRHTSATPHLPLATLSIAHAELFERFSQPASAAPSLIGRNLIIDEVRKQ